MARTGTSRRAVLAAGACLAAAAALPRAARAQGFGIPAGEFGIRADSGDDQSALIQRVIEAARVRGAPLFLPPGRYVAGGLDLAAGGPGAGGSLVGVRGSSRLVAAGGAPLIVARGDGPVGLDGLVLDGAGRGLGPADGLVAFEGAQVDIRDCAILDAQGDGIRLEGCGGRVRDTTIERARDTGLFCRDGADLDISGNHVTDCGDNGIQVWQSQAREDGARIHGNRIARIAGRSGGDGPYGNGIVVFRGGAVSVSGNRITDCVFSAIRVNAGSNVIVGHNNCARLGEVAIFVEFGFEGAVVAHNIVEGATHGISVTNFDQGGRLATVTGNLVRNIETGNFAEPRGDGIFVNADTALTGNVVENAARAGYALGYGPWLRGVVATGNIVRRAAVGFAVSVVEGIGAAVIADNLISDASRAAILGMEWEKAVTGDLATGGAAAYPQLTIEGNRVA